MEIQRTKTKVNYFSEIECNSYLHSSKTKVNYFSFLPPEIINVEIVKYLDDTSLCNLIQTSKEIYNLIDPLVIYNRKFKKYGLMTKYDLISRNCIYGIKFLIENNLIDKNVFMTDNTNYFIISIGRLDMLIYLDNKFNFINNYQETFHSSFVLAGIKCIIKNKKVSEYYLKKVDCKYFLKFIKYAFSKMLITREEINKMLNLIIEANAKFNFDLLDLAAEQNNDCYFKALVLKGYRFTDIDVIKEIERFGDRYRNTLFYRNTLVFRAMLMYGKKRMLMNIIKKITKPETMLKLFGLIKSHMKISRFLKEEYVSWINYFLSKTEYKHLKKEFDELKNFLDDSYGRMTQQQIARMNIGRPASYYLPCESSYELIGQFNCQYEN